MASRDKDSDSNLNPVLELLRDVKKDVRSTKGIVDNINRELGGVQSTLSSMEKRNEKQDLKLEDMQKNQLECPARAGHKGVNSRLRRIEDSSNPSSAWSYSEIPWQKIIIKILPFLIVAFAVGAGTMMIWGLQYLQGG